MLAVTASPRVSSTASPCCWSSSAWWASSCPGTAGPGPPSTGRRLPLSLSQCGTPGLAPWRTLITIRIHTGQSTYIWQLLECSYTTRKIKLPSYKARIFIENWLFVQCRWRVYYAKICQCCCVSWRNITIIHHHHQTQICVYWFGEYFLVFSILTEVLCGDRWCFRFYKIFVFPAILPSPMFNIYSRSSLDTSNSQLVSTAVHFKDKLLARQVEMQELIRWQSQSQSHNLTISIKNKYYRAKLNGPFPYR